LLRLQYGCHRHWHKYLQKHFETSIFSPRVTLCLCLVVRVEAFRGFPKPASWFFHTHLDLVSRVVPLRGEEEETETSRPSMRGVVSPSPLYESLSRLCQQKENGPGAIIQCCKIGEFEHFGRPLVAQAPSSTRIRDETNNGERERETGTRPFIAICGLLLPTWWETEMIR
jgi:hypothetical protein